MENLSAENGSAPDNKKKTHIPEAEECSYPSDKLLGAKDLMKISLKMMEERFSTYLVITILFLTFFMVVCLPAVFSYFLLKNLALTLTLGFFAFVLIVILSLLQSIVIVEIVGDKDLRIREALRKATPLLLSYFKASLAYLSIFIGFCFAVFVLAFAAIMLCALFSDTVLKGAAAFACALALFLIAVVFVLVCILLGVGQDFLFFSLVVDGKSVLESLAYAYGLIKNYKRDIVCRLVAFVGFYFLMLIPFAAIAQESYLASVLYQLVNFILGLWMILYLYAMYKNLKAVRGAAVKPQDVTAVQGFIKTGMAFIVLSGIFFFLAMVTAFAISMPEY